MIACIANKRKICCLVPFSRRCCYCYVSVKNMLNLFPFCLRCVLFAGVAEVLRVFTANDLFSLRK